MMNEKQIEAAKAQGMIPPDSQEGRALGFTSDRFDGWLWKSGERMWISFIESRQEGKGHLSELFNTIEAAGYYIAVPTPFPHMEAILQHKGFEPHLETVEGGESCEVWYKPRPSQRADKLHNIKLKPSECHLAVRNGKRAAG